MSISNYRGLKIVNTSTAGNQYQVTAAGLEGGKIVVAWFDENLQTIRAQSYDAHGDAIGGEFGPMNLASDATHHSDQPRLSADPSGAFFGGDPTSGYWLAFQGYGIDSNMSPYKAAGLNFYDSNGNGGFAGATSGTNQSYPAVNKGYVAYEDDAVNGGDIINGRNVQTMNITTAGLQTWPDVAYLAGNARYVISWWDDDNKQVKARLLDASNNNPISGELMAGSVGNAAGTSQFGYRGQAIAALTGGNFVIVWNSRSSSDEDSSGYGIQASIYNSNGIRLNSGFQVNTTTFGDQEHPSVVGLLDGGFAVAWNDVISSSPTLSHVVVRTFDSSGNPTSGEFSVDGIGHLDFAPQLTLLADGRIAVVWEADQSVSQDTSGYHVEMQIVDPRSAAVTLTAVAAGSDLVGTAFNDQFTSGVGNDRFEGGAGVDSAVFSHARSAYTTAATGSGVQVSGPDGTDTLTGIERLVFAGQVVPQPRSDFDGTFASDILWRHDNGAVSIWDNGAISGAHVISQAGVVPNTWHISGKGDFDGNGKSDILWRNDDGAVSIWDNGAIGGAHVIANAGVVPNSWHISGTGDFDGNGRSDILWRNDNGAVSIWDDGAISGAHVISNAGVVPNSWRIAATGDFKGDGHTDILWRNDNGAVSIWDDGQISGAHVIASGIDVPTAWHISGTGDFNHNGIDDILWRHDNGTVSVWDDGSIVGARLIAATGVVPTAWHISDVADYNSDGISDILWRHDNGTVSIWDNGVLGNAHVIVGAGVVALDWHIS